MSYKILVQSSKNITQNTDFSKQLPKNMDEKLQQFYRKMILLFPPFEGEDAFDFKAYEEFLLKAVEPKSLMQKIMLRFKKDHELERVLRFNENNLSAYGFGVNAIEISCTQTAAKNAKAMSEKLAKELGVFVVAQSG